MEHRYWVTLDFALVDLVTVGMAVTFEFDFLGVG